LEGLVPPAQRGTAAVVRSASLGGGSRETRRIAAGSEISSSTIALIPSGITHATTAPVQPDCTLFVVCLRRFYAPPYGRGGALSDIAIRPSVCPSLGYMARWLPAA